MNTKKVLIVDDVNFSLQYSKSYFDLTNYSVLTSVNGVEALDLMRRERPDLVLTDLFMPQMNGDEMCSIIKADPSLRNTPVVMFTSSSSEDDKKRCFEAGCDDFIRKPILNLDLFFTNIKRFIPDIRYREYPRFSIDTAVSYQADGREGPARLLNISEGGVLISGDLPLSTGEKADIAFKMPVSGRQVEAKGKVARIIPPSASDSSPGIGIQFIHVNMEGRRAISEYIRSNSK